VHLKALERSIAVLRLVAVPFVVVLVGIVDSYPAGYEAAAWIVTALFAVGAVGFVAVTWRGVAQDRDFVLSLAGQVFDTAIIVAFVVVFSFARGTPVQQLLYVALVAACVRFAVIGGLAAVVVSIPVVAVFAKLRSDRFDTAYSWQLIVFQTAIELMMALIVGGLVRRLAATAATNIDAYENERRTVEELRRVSALRADFVSLVSHELRSPIAAVIGSARTLRKRWRELSPEHRDSFLALICDEADRLADLVNDVFDTSRIDAGTFGYSFSEVDVAALVEETAATADAVQDDIEVVVRLAPGLPVVRGDGVRLRQVLGNLLENAVKYSPAGGAVEVGAVVRNGWVLIDVTDRGSGIAPENQAMIFEKFGRIHGPEAQPGTGLGLYIARSIAEAHGGAVDVASVPGKGSTFTLTLPIA
jgi:signal transduction histidine kinase